MESQIILDLVATDNAPDLPVRFTGLDLSVYDSIKMVIRRDDGSKKELTVTPDGTDVELGTVAWGDPGTVLIPGRHEAEFLFHTDSPNQDFRLPRKYPIILNVRSQVG